MRSQWLTLLVQNRELIHLTICLVIGQATGARVRQSLFLLDTRRPTWSITSPALTALNSAITSAWVSPCRGLEFIDNISSPERTTTTIDNYDNAWVLYVLLLCLPSLTVPKSAAWPLGNTVFTYMPMFPRGLSVPPTILKPSPLCPGPFKNRAVRMVNETPLLPGLGRVQNFDSSPSPDSSMSSSSESLLSPSSVSCGPC